MEYQQITFKTDDGYTVSIRQGHGAYGNPDTSAEVAIKRESDGEFGFFDETGAFKPGDVYAWRNPAELARILYQVANR